MTRRVLVCNQICATFCVLLASSMVQAYQAPAVRETGSEHEFDVASMQRLNEKFDADVEAGVIAGCVALVAHGDEVVYTSRHGFQDREQQTPMEDSTIFRIYSMSKPITSVAVMMLVEREEVGLDQPLSTYLPEFAEMQVLVQNEEGGEPTFVPAEREITVRDLLRHTSGLTYGYFDETPVDLRYRELGILATDPNLEQFSRRLSSIPLKHQPGTRFEYSVSTDLLGRLVEAVSGQSFDTFLKTQIFEPLGMEDTFFIVPQAKRERLAQMYRRDTEGGLVPSPVQASRMFLREHEFFSGGGGLCSTAADYLAFARMLLNEGAYDGGRLLSAESVAEMTSNQLKDVVERSNGFQFGLGFSIDRQGRYGWGGIAGTRFWIDPERDVIGLFMVQVNPYRGVSYEDLMKQAVTEALR